MSYNLIKQLPSCVVERKLLLELEGYMRRKIAELAPPFENITSALTQSFIVIDKFGLENLKSVEEFQRTYFPDDTQRISIEVRSVGKNTLSIEIHFTPAKSGSNLSVRFDGSSAREVVTGIAAEIISIMESYKTSNHWFHHLGNVPLGLILYTVAMTSLMILTSFQLSHIDTFTYVILCLILGGATLAISSIFSEKFRPYSTFETKRNEKRKKQLNWIVLGVLGFILFTVVGVFLGLKLFGF